LTALDRGTMRTPKAAGVVQAALQAAAVFHTFRDLAGKVPEPDTEDHHRFARVPAAALGTDIGSLSVRSGAVPDVEWSEWLPFVVATQTAPRLPGVYLVRRTIAADVVYIGSAGERRGAGLRGRLRVYASGKGAVSGLGEAVLDRAVADADWLRSRLAEVAAGHPRRVKEWARLAMEWAELEVCWTVTADKASAEALERQLIVSFTGLWNRRYVVTGEHPSE